MTRYKLWNCEYSFETPSDIAGDKYTENYIVAARNYTEAVYKGEMCLSNNPAYVSLKLTPADVKLTVKVLGKNKIKIPKLSLDADDFEVSARLTRGSLEFIVKKK